MAKRSSHPIWYAAMLDNTGLRQGESEALRIWKNMQRDAANAGSGIEKIWQKAGAAVAGYLSIQSISQFVSQIVRIRGEFQQLEISFGTMLKSGDKAKKLMSDLSEFAATTPFGLQSSASAAKQLLAYGSTVETLIDEMRMLGDVAAGTSQPIGDLVYLYGTLRTQGRAYMMDIRQFAGRGIPIYDELAKVLGVSKDRVNEFVSAGKVGFAEVEQAFKNMTTSGGMYGGLMEAQSKSVTGRIEQLKDAVDIMFNEMGKASEGAIYGAISGAASLVENYEKVGKILVSLIATYGAYRTAVIVATVAEKGWTVAQLAHYNVLLIVEKAQKLLNKTMLANPYVLVATVLVGLVATMWTLRDSTTASEKAQKDHNDRLNEAKTKYDELISVVRDETKAIEDRQEALENLRKLYPKLFADMDIEAVKLANLADLTRQAATEDKSMMRTRAERMIAALDEDAGRQRNIIRSGSILERGEARRRLKEIEQERKIQQDLIKGYDDQLADADELRKKATSEAEKAAAAAPRNKAFWDTQKKSAEDALAAMDASTKGGAEWNKQMALINEANAKLQTWNFGGSKSSTQPQNDAKEAISLQRKYEDEVAQARVDAMNDGLEKVLAQNELNFQREKAQIEEEYAKLSDVEHQFLIDAAKARKDAADASAYGDEFSFDWDAEMASLDEYLIEYGSYQEKRLGITQKYEKLISDAQTSGERMSLGKERDKELKNLKKSLIEESSIWKKLFSDLDKVPTNALKKLHEDATVAIKASNLSIEEQAELLRQLEQVQDKLVERDPWGQLKSALERYRKALAEEDDTEAFSAWSDVQEATRGIKDQISQLADAFSGIGQLFGDDFSKAINNVVGVVDNAITAFENLGKSGAKSSGDTIKGISGIIGIITFAVGSLVDFVNKSWSESIRESADAYSDFFDKMSAYTNNLDYVRLFGKGSLDGINKYLNDQINIYDELMKRARQSVEDTDFGLDLFGNKKDNAFDKAISNAVEEFKALFNVDDPLKNFTDSTSYLYQEARKLNGEFTKIGYNAGRAFNFEGAQEELTSISIQIITLQQELLATQQAMIDAKKKKDKAQLAQREKELQESLQSLITEGATITTNIIDDVLGTNIEGIAQKLGDSLVEAFKNGENAADAWGKAVDEIIRDIALNKMLYKALEEPINNAIDSVTKDWFDESGSLNLSNDKLRQELKDLDSLLTELGPQFAPVVEMIKDVFGFGEDANDTASRTSSSQGFAQASQDSIDKIDGILTNIQNHTYGIFELMKSSVPGGGGSSIAFANIEAPVVNIAEMMRANQQIQQSNTDNILGQLTNIDINTRPIAEMQKDIHYMRGRTDDMADSLDKFTRG